MSFNPQLRQVDRRRTVQYLTAWMYEDREALDAVLDEANGDQDGGMAGLLFGVTACSDWVLRNTGPLLNQPEDADPRVDPQPPS